MGGGYQSERRGGSEGSCGSVQRRPAEHDFISQKMLKNRIAKSIPAKIRQLILYIGDSEGYVDEFLGELTSAKRL